MTITTDRHAELILGGPIAWTVRLVSWAVVISVGAVLLVAVIVPRIGGATPYTVLTGSMSPSMPAGTLVVVKPVDAADVRVGSVITYQIESGRPTVVTHRVVAVGVDGAGERIFRTRGDANSAGDAAPVRPIQLKGERWYSVPLLGHVNTLFTSRERDLTMVAVVAGLALYSAYMFAAAARQHRSDKRTGRHS